MITKKCQSIIFYYTILYYYIWVEILFLYKNHKKNTKNNNKFATFETSQKCPIFIFPKKFWKKFSQDHKKNYGKENLEILKIL